MRFSLLNKALLLAGLCALSACQGFDTSQNPTALRLQPWSANGNIEAEAVQLLSSDGFWPGADRLLSSKKQGLFLLDDNGNSLSQLPGTFGGLDHRIGTNGLLVAAIDVDRQQAMLVNLAAGSKTWGTPHYVPKPAFKIDGVCLYRDAADNEFLFLVGEEGLGEQWLVAHQTVPLANPQRVRGLSLPPASEHCQVDDATELLYINEENVGLWAYAAHAEADLSRQAVDLLQPFGGIGKAVAGMALVPGGVLAIDPANNMLHRYSRIEGGWQAEPALALGTLNEPENLSARVKAGELELLLRDDDGFQQTRLDWLPVAANPVAALPILPAQVQTDLIPSLGDAADDPAIWLHPDDPAASRILATDKQGGLLVYDLVGKELQDMRVGRLNNVDVRAGFHLDGVEIDLAVASNRDHNSLHLFAIDRSSGVVRELGQLQTSLQEIYGLCMFKNRQGIFYAIANGKDGSFLQYRLDAIDGEIEATRVRQFKVGSQPEGCVADDAGERLFVGEEDVALWSLDARADAPAQLKKVIGVGENIHADIEGVAFYHGAAQDYLVISSQGNDSYAVLDGHAPYRFRGAFRIGLNATLAIDGASETDGLEVTSANLGGPWSQGLLVVQDGRKRMPAGNQNYKYLPWSAVAEALNLE